MEILSLSCENYFYIGLMWFITSNSLTPDVFQTSHNLPFSVYKATAIALKFALNSEQTLYSWGCSTNTFVTDWFVKLSWGQGQFGKSLHFDFFFFGDASLSNNFYFGHKTLRGLKHQKIRHKHFVCFFSDRKQLFKLL